MNYTFKQLLEMGFFKGMDTILSMTEEQRKFAADSIEHKTRISIDEKASLSILQKATERTPDISHI